MIPSRSATQHPTFLSTTMPPNKPTASPSIAIPDGVNIQTSYFCNGDQDLGFSLMNLYPKIKTVRIEIDPGTASVLTDFARWIREAIANGKTVIATYHPAASLGSNNVADIMTAANWWKNNYATLAASGPFIINLINEWGDHFITAAQYADAYNQAIAAVRSVYSGNIICDIPGWGQEFHTAADASPLITDPKIIFSAHIYPGAWDSKTGTPTIANIDSLTAAGRPCIIGEFGSKGGGSADWSGLVDYAKGKGWSVIGWAWNGDGSSPRMNMASPYWGDSNGCSTPGNGYTISSYFATIYQKLSSSSSVIPTAMPTAASKLFISNSSFACCAIY